MPPFGTVIHEDAVRPRDAANPLDVVNVVAYDPRSRLISEGVNAAAIGHFQQHMMDMVVGDHIVSGDGVSVSPVPPAGDPRIGEIVQVIVGDFRFAADQHRDTSDSWIVAAAGGDIAIFDARLRDYFLFWLQGELFPNFHSTTRDVTKHAGSYGNLSATASDLKANSPEPLESAIRQAAILSRFQADGGRRQCGLDFPAINRHSLGAARLHGVVTLGGRQPSGVREGDTCEIQVSYRSAGPPSDVDVHL